MKVHKKMIAAFDKRQAGYNHMMKAKDGEHKQIERMNSGGYKRPGSRNPRKARSG